MAPTRPSPVEVCGGRELVSLVDPTPDGHAEGEGKMSGEFRTGNGWKYNVTLFADQETRGRRGDHTLDDGRHFLPPPSSSWEASQVPK